MRKRASLLSEMADRAMYGTLSVFDKDILSDLIIIDKAIEGVSNLVWTGTKSCLRESRHAKKVLPEVLRIDKNTLPKFGDSNAEEYIKILDSLVESFMDNIWNESFGGRPWAKIALSLKTIVEAYMEYKNEKDSSKKIELGNRVIYLMNLFDNLAHNTGSIFGKMLFEENPTGYNRNKLVELMDSKNLKNPYEALVVAEKNLDMDLPYKEKYLSKIRGRGEYKDAKRADYEFEIKEIRRHKNLIIEVSAVFDQLKDFNSTIEEKVKKTKEVFFEIDNLLGNFVRGLEEKKLSEVNIKLSSKIPTLIDFNSEVDRILQDWTYLSDLGPSTIDFALRWGVHDDIGKMYKVMDELEEIGEKVKRLPDLVIENKCIIRNLDSYFLKKISIDTLKNKLKKLQGNYYKTAVQIEKSYNKYKKISEDLFEVYQYILDCAQI